MFLVSRCSESENEYFHTRPTSICIYIQMILYYGNKKFIFEQKRLIYFWSDIGRIQQPWRWTSSLVTRCWCGCQWCRSGFISQLTVWDYLLVYFLFKIMSLWYSDILVTLSVSDVTNIDRVSSWHLKAKKRWLLLIVVLLTRSNFHVYPNYTAHRLRKKKSKTDCRLFLNPSRYNIAKILTENARRDNEEGFSARRQSCHHLPGVSEDQNCAPKTRLWLVSAKNQW